MSVLVGDVNQSGAVTVEDYTLVLANSGNVADSSTFKYDVTHNGIINSSDYGYTQTLAGQGDSLYPDFAFTSHYYHARSGLYLAPYRAYSPVLGRWLSRDPLKNAEMRQGPNLYEYVGNNSIRLADPFGLDAFVYNTGGITGHTAFVITDPSGGILVFHQYAAGHMAGSSWSSSIQGFVYDKSVVWYQEAPSISQWLADEHRAGNDFLQEAAFPGNTLTDELVIAQLEQLVASNDIPYSYIAGDNCHKFAYDWLINYARTEAAVRGQR
jgi:RHS repeat-associated protein